MRCILQNSQGPFLRYGNPDTPFQIEIKIFWYISSNWSKLWRKIIFSNFQSRQLWQNEEITLKVTGNPEKVSKNSKCRKLWQKPYLIVEKYLEGNWITLNAHFLHFPEYTKIGDFGSKLRLLNGFLGPKTCTIVHKKFQGF